MAYSPQERYVDPSLAASDGTGTRATISLSAATFTFSTLNLNETNAFSGYTFVTGDEIFLSGGTAVTTGFHTIASRTDASNIVMAADITSDSSDPTDVTADSKPYGDLQFGLDTADHPSSGGGRMNIKAGTDEILGAALDLNTSGTGYLQANATSGANPLLIQGYTTQANDGGLGGISGNNSVAILNATTQANIKFRDIHIHNVGNNVILNLDNDISLINCEFDACTSEAQAIDLDARATVIGCLFHDINGECIRIDNGLIYRNRFIDDGASSKMARCIRINSNPGYIIENIMWMDQVGGQPIIYNTGTAVIGNSIFQNTNGTSNGMQASGSTNHNVTIINNLVEGFSGASGAGIQLPSGAPTSATFGNYVSDCTNSYENLDNAATQFDNEDVAGTSPFVNGGSKDFSPVNTGGVKEGSQPSKIGLFTV